MYDHLREIRQHENVRVVICYSRPHETCVECRDGHKRFVSVALMKTLLPSNNYDFMICGPPPMMATVTLSPWPVANNDVRCG